MHSGLPHSILSFPLLTNNVKSQLFWNRHKAWMIASSPRTVFSSAISDCIPNTAFHSSLPSERGAIWREKNGDVCLCGWWEADISHMAFLAAVMQQHKLFPLLLHPLCYKSVWKLPPLNCPHVQLHQISKQRKQQGAEFFRSNWLLSNNE